MPPPPPLPGQLPNKMSEPMSVNSITLGLATIGKDGVPIMYGGGVMADVKDYKGKTILLSGKDVFLPDVCVKIEMDNFCKMIETTSKDEAALIFPQVWKSLKNVDTDKLYREKGEAWDNLMDDIPIFYACRFVLFKTPAPVAILTENTTVAQ